MRPDSQEIIDGYKREIGMLVNKIAEDARQVIIEEFAAYCDEKWREVDQAQPTAWPTPDMQTGKKMAYNDILQYARRIILIQVTEEVPRA